MKTEQTRTKVIIKTSIWGIIANFFLAGFKAFAGFLSNSIAIILDAVNNLSDAISSFVTIIGAKLAGKKPNKKHPYGHGRMEYLSAMIVAIIIIYAGITSMWESVKKIIWPENPDYSTVALIIVSVAIVVKVIVGIIFRKIGKKVNSDALVGSGNDALSDSIISVATLISAIIFIYAGLSLEAYLAVIISIFILKTGFGTLKNSVSRILGERVGKDITTSVKNIINSFDGVYGVYDLTLDNYGPDKYMGSVHIEVQDTCSAVEIDELTRKITKKVYEKLGVIINAVGIYSLNTKDKQAVEMRQEIANIVHAYSQVLQMHGFYLNKNDKIITFDIILDFEDKNRVETYKQIYDKVQSKYPDYKIYITMDIDASD